MTDKSKVVADSLYDLLHSVDSIPSPWKRFFGMWFTCAFVSLTWAAAFIAMPFILFVKLLVNCVR